MFMVIDKEKIYNNIPINSNAIIYNFYWAKEWI